MNIDAIKEFILENSKTDDEDKPIVHKLYEMYKKKLPQKKEEIEIFYWKLSLRYFDSMQDTLNLFIFLDLCDLLKIEETQQNIIILFIVSNMVVQKINDDLSMFDEDFVDILGKIIKLQNNVFEIPRMIRFLEFTFLEIFNWNFRDICY